jgi:predicted DNA-binding transcriptional regulator AlpA
MLTTEQVAEMLDLSPATLTSWRSRGRGPRFVKVGHLVRYLLEDIQRWLQERTVDPKASTVKTDLS